MPGAFGVASLQRGDQITRAVAGLCFRIVFYHVQSQLVKLFLQHRCDFFFMTGLAVDAHQFHKFIQQTLLLQRTPSPSFFFDQLALLPIYRYDERKTGG